jgi:hypothetical protein
MSALWETLRGVLTLRTETFVSFRDDPNGLRRGLTWLVAVTLIAGSLGFVVDLVQNLRPVEAQIADVQSGFEEFFRQMQQFMPPGGPPPEFWDEFQKQFMASFEVGIKIGTEIGGLPTLLPQPIGTFLETLGGWWSQPFARLGGWLWYALWVMLAAKLLGGTGGLRRFLATTSLYAVPQFITILRPVPCLGPVLGLVAAVWGWVIYVKATAVAHDWTEITKTDAGQVIERTNWGRAILAVLLPLLVAVALVILLITTIAILAALASR